PRGEIDHKDGNRADNRIANLREGSHAEQMRNRVSRNSSGFKGIERTGRKWRARIQVNGTSIHIGVYNTPEDAAAAYDEAARRYHGEFAKTNADLAALANSVRENPGQSCIRPHATE